MIHSRLLNGLFILLLLLSANTIVFGQAGSNDSSTVKNNDTATDVKILIAYQSKYGSTKQYAEWIQRETGGDLVNVEKGDKPDLTGYDVVIIGGYVRTGNIVIASFIKDQWNVIKGKEVILFTISGTPPRHPKMQSIYEKSLPEEIRKEIKFFPLPGRISGKDLTFFDRFLISIGKIMEEDESLKKDMGKDFDGVKRDNLLPLLEYLKDAKLMKNRGSQRQ